MAGGIGGLSSSGPRGRLTSRSRRLRWSIRPGPCAASGHAIRELPAAERPRERLALRGPGGLTTAELIALLWGSGVRGRSAVELATDALAAHDGLAGLARATDLELAGDPGCRRGEGGPARGGLRARAAAARRLADRALDDPRPARRRRPAGPPDGRARARGAARRHPRHEEPRPARRDRLPGQRVGVAGPGRRAVPGRGPPQRRGRDPRPQPPVAATRHRHPTTST